MQVFQYFHVFIHSSLADLEDEGAIKALHALNLQREPVSDLPQSSLPATTTPSWKLMKLVLRKMEDNSAQARTEFPRAALEASYSPVHS